MTQREQFMGLVAFSKLQIPRGGGQPTGADAGAGSMGAVPAPAPVSVIPVTSQNLWRCDDFQVTLELPIAGIPNVAFHPVGCDARWAADMVRRHQSTTTPEARAEG